MPPEGPLHQGAEQILQNPMIQQILGVDDEDELQAVVSGLPPHMMMQLIAMLQMQDEVGSDSADDGIHSDGSEDDIEGGLYSESSSSDADPEE